MRSITSIVFIYLFSATLALAVDFPKRITCEGTGLMKTYKIVMTKVMKGSKVQYKGSIDSVSIRGEKTSLEKGTFFADTSNTFYRKPHTFILSKFETAPTILAYAILFNPTGTSTLILKIKQVDLTCKS